MKFNNILVILNPENEKQYALARAVRLVKEQKSHQKVRITVFLSVYNLPMKCLLYFLLKSAQKCTKVLLSKEP